MDRDQRRTKAARPGLALVAAREKKRGEMCHQPGRASSRAFAGPMVWSWGGAEGMANKRRCNELSAVRQNGKGIRTQACTLRAVGSRSNSYPEAAKAARDPVDSDGVTP